MLSVLPPPFSCERLARTRPHVLPCTKALRGCLRTAGQPPPPPFNPGDACRLRPNAAQWDEHHSSEPPQGGPRQRPHWGGRANHAEDPGRDPGALWLKRD
eukprot:scaffold1833_cov125-Isochrysis_galbana.AAC.4